MPAKISTMGEERIDLSNIHEIFNQVQDSTACHLKYVTILKKAVLLNENNEVLNGFCKCLQFAFASDFKDKNLFIERIISFAAAFAASFKSELNGNVGNNSMHPVLHYLFKFNLNLVGSAKDSHRYWSCKLLHKTFQAIEELSDDIYDEIRDAILELFHDSKATIRIQAILTLHCLQNPDDKEDLIIINMCNLLETDFNAKVRQLCLEKLAINKYVLPFLLTRVRDVDANVRLASLQKLCPIARYLKVSQKRLILQCGFNDSSQKVRDFLSTGLMMKWLESYDNDYLKLIASVRLDACEEDVKATIYFDELILNNLFKQASMPEIIRFIDVNEQKVIEYHKLNWETAIYYRIAVQFLRRNEGFEDGLNAIIPELVHMCKYIKGYLEFVENQADYDVLLYYFVLQQLFKITQGYDVSDVASRQCLNALIHQMLQNENLPTEVAEIVVGNLNHTITDVNQKSLFVCEIISNIIHGEDATDYEEMHRAELDRKHAISQVQGDLIALSEQEKHYVFAEKNFEEAARVKREIEDKQQLLNTLRTAQKPVQNEKKTDSATVLKSLNVAEALLLSPSINRFTPAIATLSSEIINPALLDENHEVKLKALKCYALCCIIDKRSACYGIHLFSGLIFSDEWEDVQILIISLKAVVDLLTIYGLTLVENEDDEEYTSDSRREDERKVFVGGTSLTDLIQALADHMGNEDAQVQETATKGVCILLLNCRITSSSLLSRLIVKWANPATDNERLKQFIGHTLNSLTRLSNCLMYFADAVTSTIRTLVYAPRGSPLQDVDIQNVLKFMATLALMPSQGPDIHWAVAYKMLSQMKEKPKAKINIAYSKMLQLLSVEINEKDDRILQLCDQLEDTLHGNPILRHIKKFAKNLADHLLILMPLPEE